LAFPGRLRTRYFLLDGAFARAISTNVAWSH
jgi:hypothetical protein